MATVVPQPVLKSTKLRASLFLALAFSPVFAQETTPASDGTHANAAKPSDNAVTPKKDDTGYFNVDWKVRRQVYFKKMTGFQAVYETVPGMITDQVRNFPEKWGRGPGGLVKRFSNQYGQFAADETIEFAMSGLRQEDPRYHRLENGNVGKRTGYALGALLWTYNDKGKKTVASARLMGIYGGWAIATVGWLPESEKSFHALMFNAGLNMLTKAGANVFREFWPDAKKKYFTKKPKTVLPPVASSQPAGTSQSNH